MKKKVSGKRLAALVVVLLVGAWSSACGPQRKNLVPTTDAGYRCLMMCYSIEKGCHGACSGAGVAILLFPLGTIFGITENVACNHNCTDAYNVCTTACEGVTEKAQP